MFWCGCELLYGFERRGEATTSAAVSQLLMTIFESVLAEYIQINVQNLNREPRIWMDVVAQMFVTVEHS
jgi:hypothetical protein